MNLTLAAIHSGRRPRTPGAAALLAEYVQRAARYIPVEAVAYATEQKLLEVLNASSGRTRPVFLATDSRGDQLSSEELATEVGKHRDGGVQLLVVGIGPADGWSPATLKRADRTIAFGRITLPHELAAVVAAEQIYRALTIRAGHPYHSGHE